MFENQREDASLRRPSSTTVSHWCRPAVIRHRCVTLAFLSTASQWISPELFEKNLSPEANAGYPAGQHSRAGDSARATYETPSSIAEGFDRLVIQA